MSQFDIFGESEGQRNKRKAIPASVRWLVLNRDNFTCRYCGQGAPEVEIHVDHVVPVAGGGSNHPDNLVVACASCNSGKSDRPLMASKSEDDWSDQPDLCAYDAGKIVGVSVEEIRDMCRDGTFPGAYKGRGGRGGRGWRIPRREVEAQRDLGRKRAIAAFREHRHHFKTCGDYGGRRSDGRPCAHVSGCGNTGGNFCYVHDPDSGLLDRRKRGLRA